MPRLQPYLRFLRRLFANLPKRAYLTVKAHGLREALWRTLTFPLRLTPIGARMGLVTRVSDVSAPARSWYAANGRPVAVVIPSYGPAKLALKAARSVKRTTNARVIVADDGSPADEVARLRASRHIDVVASGPNGGFAVNCNRGLREARPDEDVVLLNSDIIAFSGWLEVLQHAAYEHDAGITGGKLLYPDDTIQFAGAVRNPDHPQWFDHRFRFRPADHPASEVLQPALAVTGACMYVKRETLDAIGELDEEYPMAYEDVDYCLRAWESGRRVVFAPAAELTHYESKTRGFEQTTREIASQHHFWQTWGDWFDRRETREPDGGARIIYVTQDLGVGGGHRNIFEHLNGLADRGHHPEIWSLAAAPPDWYDLRVPVRLFADYAELRRTLAPLDAIKVATWWETAPHVWEASLTRGVGVYLVSDIETSYYADKDVHGQVYATYRPELEYLTISQWNHRTLLDYVPSASIVTCGVDHSRWHDLGLERAERSILALGRGNPLKNFPLTRDAYMDLPDPRPDLWLFGIEPEVAAGMGDGVTYHRKPSDAGVNELLNTCTVFLQTSRHEGFCLPVLEAMAAGAPVVCTDADGNRDFCRDGVNCLMPAANPRAVRGALEAVLGDADLRERLREGGRETAEAFALDRKLDELDAFYRDVAERRASGAMPAPTRRVSVDVEPISPERRRRFARR
jgi:GT2 family glycosyltransferase/glycosyltransferase involved in cell wall biosynthesis